MACPRLPRLLRLTSGFRQYATKIKVELDCSSIKLSKRTTDKHSPGQTQPRKVLRMPKKIEETIDTILKEQNHTALIQNGMKFIRTLHGRHAPMEEEEKELLAKAEESKLVQKMTKKKLDLNDEEYQKFIEKARTSVLRKTKAKENSWKPIEYTDQKCFQYLLLRGPADYAVLTAVLSEIVARDPDFEPRSLLDFGSGVGTVSWVVKELWKTCNEFYNVDISASMRDLAGLVLREGNPQTQISPSIFFKGFLPVTLKYTHDIVVSAYSLFELPSRKNRLETLLSLWNKADSYLVIVEEGTHAGYKLVVEARDFILEMAEREQGVAGCTGAHVFAPCAHDRACPKFLTSRYPCNFEVTYMQHPSVQSSQAVRERYSYVILKKGPRPERQTPWPRIVEGVKVRNDHIIARLCTSEGEHVEVILSKGKNKDGSYQALKYAKWGDSLPVTLKRYEDDELASKDRHRLKMMEKWKTEQKGTTEEGMENVEGEATVKEGKEKVEERGNRTEDKEVVKGKEQSS